MSQIGFRTECGISDIHSEVASLSSQQTTAAADLRAAAQVIGSRSSNFQDGLLMELSHINTQYARAENAIHDNAIEMGLMREEAQIHGRDVLARLHGILHRLEQHRSSATSSKDNLPTATEVLPGLPPASLSQAINSFSWCHCQAKTNRSSMSTLRLYELRLFSRHQTHSPHERACPLHVATQKRTREIGADVRIRLGSLLNCLVEASFWSSTGGAGGCSFGPAIRWKNLVPGSQSPIYREFFDFGTSLLGGIQPPVADVALRLREMQQNVIGLYRQEKASINDVDELGNNHLQVCCLQIRWS